MAAALCALGLSCAVAAPAAADPGTGTGTRLDNGQCNVQAGSIKGTPWSLQRLLTDQMWADTKGKGVKVAVIDTGVSRTNRQIGANLVGGKDFIGKGDGTNDTVGHGTKVAGIIAARKIKSVGFFGIAPEATIIPIRQNDDEQHGNVGTMVKAINYAIAQGADIINISQGTTQALPPNSILEQAINKARAANVLIVASAGNDGASGEQKDTYPAAFEGVLGVAASDRSNERAGFSQAGEHVDIAAPGVDMVSTVPGGGHCVDQGTSFAAPYAAGVAALLKAKNPKWTPDQIIWHMEQTADRVEPGRTDNIGWGVVDPVAAMSDDTTPTAEPTPDTARNDAGAAHIKPAHLIIGETPQERRTRYGVYVFTAGLLAIGLIVGSGVAIRDWRRKTSTSSHGEANSG
ncbi:type VII secretion-associated serine protease mycosin [Streptomyces meridianus]|uniref:Type VII secretion-associated serine protease mycosin n=1 Tax=Streptomyces meridianus TaxID=2938945 RepID=A0ABT0XBE3_9ACTN|nr:type VII secretion-associated serine protease mycosin [Streptomyces meridianus]MCM2579838.1 type VII secretion-associated serine protease mycosin [Streptomyces meridianus]